MLFILPFSPNLSKNKRSFVKLAQSRQGNLFGRITKRNEYSCEAEAQTYYIRNQIRKYYSEEKFDSNDKYIINVLNVITDHRSDCHNLIDATMDIIQDAIGVNDRNFQLIGWPHYFKERRKLSKIEKALDLDKLKGRVFVEITKASQSSELELLALFRSKLSESELERFDQSFSEI